jgi:hypothetical protein
VGTSGAYGGSPGWSGVGQQTQDWLDSGAGTGDSGEPVDGGLPPSPSDDTATQPGSARTPPIAAPLAGLIGQLGRRLASSRGGGGGAGSGLLSRPGDSGGGSTSRGRSTARASSVGGRAVAGVYGLRTGSAGPLAEIGLSLDELRGLPKHEQAQRILEAAMGPSGGVAESELRLANAELILWTLNEGTEPMPIDLANRWVVEYVWQVWITEAGPTIRSHSANGYDSYRVEQEMRAALEATVAGSGLPDGRALTTQDFEHAIQTALKSLERIGKAS